MCGTHHFNHFKSNDTATNNVAHIGNAPIHPGLGTCSTESNVCVLPRSRRTCRHNLWQLQFDIVWDPRAEGATWQDPSGIEKPSFSISFANNVAGSTHWLANRMSLNHESIFSHHAIMVVQFLECLETPNLHCDFAALTENTLHTSDTHSLEGKEKAANSHAQQIQQIQHGTVF